MTPQIPSRPWTIRWSAVTLAAALAVGACSDDDGGSVDAVPGASTEDVAELTERIDALETDLARVDEERAGLMADVEALSAAEEIRGILHAVSNAVDTADVESLERLVPRVADDFTLTAVEFGPNPERLVFEGIDGLLDGFGPIMEEAQANLLPSSIDVAPDIEGDLAVARFKFANSVVPPVVINDEIDVKVLLFADITAEFRREDGVWMITSLELIHSLAYPGSVQAVLQSTG